MTTEYAPPFPWFGGKSAVADICWRAFGADVDNYVEPFAGSLAVLMLRPGFDWATGAWDGEEYTETVNDADGLVANFFRATSDAPDEVATYADQPVNEADLHARHVWLLGKRDEITARLMGDPDWYDPKAAGWWVWGQCCWISGGWCAGNGPWTSVDGVFVKGEGQGVNRQRPHLGDAGRGVNRKRPHLNTGQGVCESYYEHLRAYFARLRDRLRRVRVCCGDWSRVCGDTPTVHMGTTAVLLDPPYSAEAGRDMGCYSVDCGSVAHAAREWAIERGNDKWFRIVLCGYDGEHAMPDGWRCVEWKARGGYGSQSDDGPGRVNAHRERLWLSPHCLPDTEDHLWAP